MSRHQTPRDGRRRLMIAAIAATALIGTTVTIGILGSASAGENTQAASEQCVSNDQNGEQQSNLPEDGQNAGDGQGEQDAGGQGQDEQNGGDQGQDEQNGGDQGQDEQNGDEQPQPQDKTYGVTGPQAARPGNPVNENDGQNGDGQNGDGQNGDGQNGDGQNGDGQNGDGQNGDGQNGDGQNGDGQNEDGQNEDGQNEDGQNEDGQNEDEQAQCVGPFPEDFVDITTVEPNVVEPEPGENASTGTFVSECGNNQELHQNTDNIVIAPGTPNGAEHLHDYVGNLDTTFASNEESLAAGETTCANGDQSTYFWPILRNRSPDDGFDQASVKDENNIGEPVLPASVLVEWRGNATSQVEAAPRFLRLFSGDAKTITNGLGNAKPTYTCTGFEDRVINKYPLCPEGSTVVSVHDYPGCWDGENVDSENHRDHLAFADEETGACPEGTVAIPQLRVTLTYGDNLNNVAQGFAVDGFSTEEHDPASDHAGAINVMSEELMQEAVDAINGGDQG